MPEVAIDDDWSPLDDLVALHGAEDAGELHRRQSRGNGFLPPGVHFA